MFINSSFIFNGFISGKLVDSLIVGIICFVCLSLLKIPYGLLISVIVGVTNIIPMFGPFIGAVPSAFLLLLVSPAKCLVFIVFVIILQQVDGNIIGPRILGNSTGLSALYVTVAMLLFGKLMGFLGMIVGVPLFATLYYIVKRLAEYSLGKQGLPTDTDKYEETFRDGAQERESAGKQPGSVCQTRRDRASRRVRPIFHGRRPGDPAVCGNTGRRKPYGKQDEEEKC